MNAELEHSGKQLLELIGSKVELEVPSGRFKGAYASRLEEVEDKLVMGLAHPTLRGARVPLMRSSEFSLKIEAFNCFYRAKASIVRDSPSDATLPLLWLRLEVPLEKVQRRMHVRVPCSIPAEAFFLGRGKPRAEPSPSSEEEEERPQRQWFQVRIVDISLGGCGILVSKALRSNYVEGGRYLLSLCIEGKSFFLTGKLVTIFQKNALFVGGGLAYDGVSVFLEKLMGSFIRQQELLTRG
jgi:c-di-GMP-binding flagellar brake protein YcgR